MIAIANILFGLGQVLDLLLTTFLILLFVRAIISWVNPDPYNPIVRFLIASTDPILRPIQKIIPPIGGGFDLSPLIALLIIYFLKAALAQTLIDYALQMKRQAQFALSYPLGALAQENTLSLIVKTFYQ